MLQTLILMFIAKKRAQQLNSDINEDKLETPAGAGALQCYRMAAC